MKKKISKSLLAFGIMACGFSSCTVSHSAIVTNNAVGKKTGTAKGTIFNPNLDVTFKKAKEEGKITKVGIAEMKTKVFIIPFYSTTVTGE